MKNLRQTFAQLAAKYQRKCDPSPGKWNSCEPCKNCGKRAKYPESGGTPPPPCCGLFPNVPFWNDANAPVFVMSEPLQMEGITCRTTLTITVEMITGDPSNAIINVNSDGSPIEIYPNVPQSITVVNGDFVYFDMLNVALTEDICINVSMFNETCQIDYGRVLNNLCATIS